MTSAAVLDRDGAAAPVPEVEDRGAPTRPARVALACVALLAVYGVLSLAIDPRATLGSDSSGKLATLEVMSTRGRSSVDIGYWAAADDPSAALHPLYYTGHVGEGFVQATTLPQLLVMSPLYDAGGARAALLVPMIGGVLAALAARALARRLGTSDGWEAFWAIGLATPVTLYALDVWEHALGLGLMAWGVVLLYDVGASRAGWRSAFAGGALLGLAATMRTEALVALFVAASAACVVTLVRCGVRAAILRGIALSAGALVPLAANELLERALIGSALRTGRAAGTAAQLGGDMQQRLQEALTALTGLNRFVDPTDWILGAVIVANASTGAWLLGKRRAPVAGGACLAAAGILVALLFADGLGFVPGLLSASPLAAAGIVLAWSDRRHRVVAAAAVAMVVITWVTQYAGGMRPQWGGRYILLPGLLLATIAVVVLTRRPRALLAVVALSGLVTAGGLAWYAERSHTIVDGMEALVAREDDAVISVEAHLLREGGSFYTPARHWLTATDGAALDRAFAIVRKAGDREVAVLARAGTQLPDRFEGFERRSSTPFELRPGEPLSVVEYRATGAHGT